MAETEPFPTADYGAFLSNTPLYRPYFTDFNDWNAFLRAEVRADGHCPYCSDRTTFKAVARGGAGRALGYVDRADWIKSRGYDVFEGFSGMELECARNPVHRIFFTFMAQRDDSSKDYSLKIQKIGQYPSLADVVQDEFRKYRKVFPTANDASEFHRAVGLAAHGVGIGSFVYLRRIFERLIRRRFDEFKQAEGWTDDQFIKLRMDERIELLKDHLPAFMVENSRVYSILSAGIHELDDERCLGLFSVLRSSILLILQEDERKRQELEMRAELKVEIAKFQQTKPEASK